MAMRTFGFVVIVAIICAATIYIGILSEIYT